MSALVRCARYSRLFSRSMQSYCRNTANTCLNRKENVFCALQLPFTRRVCTTKRVYSVLSGENNVEVNTKEETSLDSQEKAVRKRKVMNYSENYPASDFWKNYDFLQQNSKLSLGEACTAMYLAIYNKRYVVLENFYELMAIVEQHENFTEDELMLIFRSLGNENQSITEEMRIRWTEYLLQRFQSLGVPLSVSHYNEALKNYSIANHKLSPVKFLSDMEQHGVTPNVLTLSRVVGLYCKMGDTKSASKILEHLRKENIVINEFIYRHLIKGNLMEGNEDVAMKLFYNSGEMGFEYSSTLYEAVITGYALSGNLDGVKKIMSEAEDNMILLPNIAGTVLQSVVPEMSTEKHKEVIDYFLSGTPQANKWKHSVVRTIKVIMESGNFDMAFKYFTKLPGTTNDLFNCAVIAGMGRDDIVKYVEMMKKLGLKDATYHKYFAFAIQKCQYETALAVLPFVKSEGTMRPEFIWPLVRYYDIMQDPKGMEDLVPYVQSDDFSSIVFWLAPSLSNNGRGSGDLKRLLKESSNFSEGQQNAIMIFLKGKNNSWKNVAEYARTLEVIEDIDDGMERMLVSAAINGVNKDNWRDIADICFALKNSDIFGLLWKLQRVADHQELKDYILEKDFTFSRNEFSKDFKALFSPEELERLLKKGLTNEQVRAMSYSELLDTYKVMKNFRLVKCMLMRESFNRKDWKMYKNLLLSAKDLNPAKTDLNVLVQMAYYYAIIEGEIFKSCEIIQGIESDFNPPRFDTVLELCQVLCENERFKEALMLIEKVNYEGHIVVADDVDLLDRNSLFNVKPTSQNIKNAKEILSAMYAKGYFKSKLIRRHCLKQFWEFVSGSEDFGEVTDALDFLNGQFGYEPKNFVQVFSKYVKAGDKVNLQSAFDKLTDYCPEQKVLLNLAAAFMENGDISKAKKVLLTPGLRLRSFDKRNIMERWAQNGEPKLIETLGSLTSSLPGDVDYIDMLSLQLQAMCYQENCDVDKCISFFERHFEYDDDVDLPDNKSLKMYARLLQKHRPEKRLDNYLLNLIETEERQRDDNINKRLKLAQRKKDEPEKYGSNIKQRDDNLNQRSMLSQPKTDEPEKDRQNLKKFKTSNGDELDFQEVMERFNDITDEELKVNLQDVNLASRLVNFLSQRHNPDILLRVLDFVPEQLLKVLNKNDRKISFEVMERIYEVLPDQLNQALPNMSNKSANTMLAVAVWKKDSPKINEILKIHQPSFSMMRSAFDRVRGKAEKLNKTDIQDVFFNFLDADLGDLRATVYAMTLFALKSQNATDGIENLAQKVQSAGLTIQSIVQEYPGRKDTMIETVKSIEQDFMEQKRPIPWEPSNTWVMESTSEQTEQVPEDGLVNDKSEPEMKDNAPVITEDSSQGSLNEPPKSES